MAGQGQRLCSGLVRGLARWLTGRKGRRLDSCELGPLNDWLGGWRDDKEEGSDVGWLEGWLDGCAAGCEDGLVNGCELGLRDS